MLIRYNPKVLLTCNERLGRALAHFSHVYVVKVLRILEGDMVMDQSYVSASGCDVGSRSGRICGEQQQHYSGPLLNEAMEGFSGKLSLGKARPPYWDRDKGRRTSCEDDL